MLRTLGHSLLSFAILVALLLPEGPTAASQTAISSAPPTRTSPEKIIIDTDIGDDIDDAFAVALALRSPELQILGLTADSGDTTMRAEILDRMVGDDGRDIPVTAGIPTRAIDNGTHDDQRPFTQYSRFRGRQHPAAVAFILHQIRLYPHQITLVTIGPLSNVRNLIDTDPAAFRQLKRVVMMGGWVRPLAPEFGPGEPVTPGPEWNIRNDVAGAQKLFTSGVPIDMMPIDSTVYLRLTDQYRGAIFLHGTPVTDDLTLLYEMWSASTRGTIPILFDAMTIAYILNPNICPTTPMHITVDDKGRTLVVPGPPNAQVCLRSDPETFLRFYMNRILK